MALFKNTGGKLTEIDEKKIQLEKHIQKLTEDNLENVFGLQFIATEFEYESLRLDTVAYDRETKAFVVIEYKRDRSFSVVDQGYAYLSLMLNNKAEFILLYNEAIGGTLRKNDVDWSQSRVIFVARSFTPHQQQAINFRDMPIELWQVAMFAGELVLYDQIKSRATSESIKVISRDPEIQKVSNQVKVYEVKDHFSGSKANTFELFEELRDKIIQLLPSVNENPRKYYIGYALKENGTDTVLTVHVQTNALKVEIPRIRPEDVIDPASKLVFLKNSLEQYGTPYSILHIKSSEDVDYLVTIIKQVYKKFFAH